MKKNSLQSYKVQYRLKSELKTMNQIPLSPLRMSSLVVVHCTRDHLANIIAYLTLHFWVNGWQRISEKRIAGVVMSRFSGVDNLKV